MENRTNGQKVIMAALAEIRQQNLLDDYKSPLLAIITNQQEVKATTNGEIVEVVNLDNEVDVATAYYCAKFTEKLVKGLAQDYYTHMVVRYGKVAKEKVHVAQLKITQINQATADVWVVEGIKELFLGKLNFMLGDRYYSTNEKQRATNQEKFKYYNTELLGELRKYLQNLFALDETKEVFVFHVQWVGLLDNTYYACFYMRRELNVLHYYDAEVATNNYNDNSHNPPFSLYQLLENLDKIEVKDHRHGEDEVERILSVNSHGLASRLYCDFWLAMKCIQIGMGIEYLELSTTFEEYLKFKKQLFFDPRDHIDHNLSQRTKYVLSFMSSWQIVSLLQFLRASELSPFDQAIAQEQAISLANRLIHKEINQFDLSNMISMNFMSKNLTRN